MASSGRISYFESGTDTPSGISANLVRERPTDLAAGLNTNRGSEKISDCLDYASLFCAI